MGDATPPTAAAGEEPLRLVVGLGNPGERYAPTRHNVGFRVLGELARRWSVDLEAEECNARVARLGGALLVAPQTFMNRSGFAVRCLGERHPFEASGVLVVYDEVHLPLGRLRLRKKGSPGGHRGMESMLENLRTDEVPRLRCGIAPERELDPEDLVSFVLEPFAADETETVEEMVLRAADACECWLEEGIESAMNRFNG